MELQWISVQSSTVQSVAYDEEGKELHVRFKPSSYYIYSRVPKSIFDGLLAAPSKGKYLDQHVKKAGYPYRRA